MKTILALSVLLFVASGCKTTPVFRVTTALDPCDKGVLTGIVGGVEYALTPPGDPTSPEYLGVACYGVIEPSDVGKSFPVEIGPDEITLTVDGDKFKYRVLAARVSK